MERRMRLIVAVLLLSTLTSVVFAQRGFRRGFAPTPDQPLRGEPKEWTFARLAYGGGGFRGRGGWGTDYPGAEYHFSQAVDRLTRIDVHPEGHVVSPDSDELFDYPWLYAVEVGSWTFTDSQASRMREHLLRGGFLMVDDFHGSVEWEGFMATMRRVYPDRPIVELPVSDEVFHVLYDLIDRPQIPSIYGAMTGRTWERDGYTPHWRGIYDENGRLAVVINFNMDLGDAWEHADSPQYPQPLTALAYRYAINYLLYSMSH